MGGGEWVCGGRVVGGGGELGEGGFKGVGGCGAAAANLHPSVYREVHRQGNSISTQLAFWSARASQKKKLLFGQVPFPFFENTYCEMYQPFCCIASCPHCSAAHNYYSSKLLSNYPIAIVPTT